MTPTGAKLLAIKALNQMKGDDLERWRAELAKTGATAEQIASNPTVAALQAERAEIDAAIDWVMAQP